MKAKARTKVRRRARTKQAAPVCGLRGRFRIVFDRDAGRVKCVNQCGVEQPLSACMDLALRKGIPTVAFSRQRCSFDASAKTEFLDKVAGKPTAWVYEDDDG